jgi:hypothetical protein
MPHAYTKDQQAPRSLTQPLPFCEHSPQPLPAGEEPGEEGRAWVDKTGLFERETKGEVVLVSRLRAALERLNPALPPEAVTGGGLIEWLTADCRKSLISSRFLFE